MHGEDGTDATDARRQPQREEHAPPAPPNLSTPAAPAATDATDQPRKRRIRRARASTIKGLTDRNRPDAASGLFSLLPDALGVALPGLRRVLLDQSLDEALRLTVEELARTLAFGVAQVWLAAPGPWMGAGERGGGRSLTPSLHLAAAHGSPATPVSTAPEVVGDVQQDQPPITAPPRPIRTDIHSPRIVQEVLASRRPLILLDAHAHPWSTDWSAALTAPDDSAATPRVAPTTLVAYPLQVHGQFLGVLALGTELRLLLRQLAQLEDLADLLALAVDREHLLSYSRSQEVLAQTVVRHAPVAMAVLSGPEYTLALCNPAFRVLLGIGGTADVTGQRLRDLAPEWGEHLAESLQLDAARERGEAQALVELPIAFTQGIRYWNVTTSPLPLTPEAGGKASAVLVAAIEVTRQVAARHAAEEAAEIAQERIAQMMTLHATSLAVAAQLGADPRELLADILRRSILLLHARAGVVYAHDAHRGELRVVICQGLRGDYTGTRIRAGQGFVGQVALSGRGRIVDDLHAYPTRVAIYEDEPFRAVIAVPLVAHGRVIGVLDVLDDAERRTFTPDDLWLLDLFASQAAQAMENARTYVELEHAYQQQRELDRLKDDFIATASHELRTPLTGVQGFLDLLLEYPGSRDEPLALDFLQKAAESAAELADIADRLLQTSRLDSGRVEVHVDAVRLAPVVDEVLRGFANLYEAQGAPRVLRAEIPPALTVRADLGRLKEVVENLVSNAIKYSAPNGEVTVSTAPLGTLLASANTRADDATQPQGTPPTDPGDPLDRLAESPTLDLPRIGDSPEADEVTRPSAEVLEAARTQPFTVLHVSDQGMGIAASEQERLFGRFSRTDAARVSQIRGTGLGLYICRQLARAMGGDVWLQSSTPGKGSTFALALPTTLVSPAAAPLQGYEEPVTSSPRHPFQ